MKHLKSRFSQKCGSIPFHKRAGNQNQHILCDLHFNSVKCCVLWAMASPAAATWFLNRNTCREWSTSPMSFSTKDRDSVEVFEIYSEEAGRGDRHAPGWVVWVREGITEE